MDDPERTQSGERRGPYALVCAIHRTPTRAACQAVRGTKNGYRAAGAECSSQASPRTDPACLKRSPAQWGGRGSGLLELVRNIGDASAVLVWPHAASVSSRRVGGAPAKDVVEYQRYLTPPARSSSSGSVPLGENLGPSHRATMDAPDDTKSIPRPFQAERYLAITTIPNPMG